MSVTGMWRALALALALALAPALAGAQALAPGQLGGLPPELGPGGAKGKPPTIWDRTFNSADVGSDNLTLTIPFAAATSAWRSTTSHSSGKYAARLTWSTSPGGGDQFGFVPTAFTNTTVTGTYSAYTTGGPAIQVNGDTSCPNSATPPLVASGQYVDIATDFTSFWIRVQGGNWNNNVSASPAAGTGGILFTCNGGPGPFTPPFFIGFSTGFANITVVLGPTTLVGDSTLSGFSNF